MGIGTGRSVVPKYTSTSAGSMSHNGFPNHVRTCSKWLTSERIVLSVEDSNELRGYFRKRTSTPLAPRRSVDPTSWLTGYHRLNIRYDRKATHYLGFLTLAAALTCYKKLAKSAT